MQLESDNESVSEYFSRITERVKGAASSSERLVAAQKLLRDAERHFDRLALSEKRFRRAQEYGDLSGSEFERKLITALLYEAADHIFMAVQLLDFDKLELRSSHHGHGLVGEAAAETGHLLNQLDHVAEKIHDREKIYGLMVDFTEPADEFEGLSWTEHPHWQNFVPGLLRESFYRYFAQAGSEVRTWLRKEPSFWERRSMETYLEWRGSLNLLSLLRKAAALASKIGAIDVSRSAEEHHGVRHHYFGFGRHSERHH